MKPFKFSLQSIRLLRQQKEQQAQQRFAEAMHACEEAAFQLQEASDALATSWATLCQELSAGVTATGLLRTRSWCNVLERRQQERTTALQHARGLMNAAWREMMFATRDREVLDRYHDRCQRAYDRGVQREEHKRLDELGIRRATVPSLLSGMRWFGKDRL
jgi:flagellar export protein FliJ